jgi:hypothetical protein
VPFFNRPQSAEKRAVNALLDEDRATLIGPIIAGILQAGQRLINIAWRNDREAHFEIIRIVCSI